MKIYCPDLEVADYSSRYINPVLLYLHRHGGSFSAGCSLSAHSDEADIATPAYLFAHYYMNKTVSALAAWAEGFKPRGVPLLVWHRGDLNPVKIENVRYLQTAIHKSEAGTSRTAIPFFIEDPVRTLFNGVWQPLTLEPKPKVGFCGYAGVNYAKVAYGIASALKDRLTAKQDINAYQPAELAPAVLLRHRALRLLEKDRQVEHNFVRRKRFNAGRGSLQDQYNHTDPATKHFFNNLIDSPYTLCVRGYGNYSVRFFETLACGRIPLFVNTDCELPFSSQIDYRKHCVWVEKCELNQIGSLLRRFHAGHTPESFRRLQEENRRLWLDYLSFEGFFSRFPELVDDLGLPIHSLAAATVR